MTVHQDELATHGQRIIILIKITYFKNDDYLFINLIFLQTEWKNILKLLQKVELNKKRERNREAVSFYLFLSANANS